MGSRPSTPLLDLLRSAARKKGWNTSTLAQHAGIDRSHLKQVLAGREPLTVDELIQLSDAMALTPADLGILGAHTDSDDGDDDDETSELPEPTVLSAAAADDDDDSDAFLGPDPFGNHARQILELGFALGVDIRFVLDTTQLGESGVPRHVLAKFPAHLPVHLEAAYHRHNAPEYLTFGLQVRLSFDAVYTCWFPWASFEQIALFPHPPEAEPEPEPEPEPEERPRGGFLRLVE